MAVRLLHCTLRLAVLPGLAAALSLGCGGGGGSADPPALPVSFGALSGRMAGTSQPPVTSSAADVVVTGLAGATVTALSLQNPAPSIGQTKVVFEDGPHGAGEIRLMNADGSHAAVLDVDAITPDEDPAWSPDAVHIAFDRGGNGIWVINQDGSGLKQLTSGADSNPAWSPDGKKIAYVRTVNSQGPVNESDIYAMNADGTAQTKLTSGVVDQFPAWSPDGSKIMVLRTIQVPQQYGGSLSEPDLYVMNPDGSGVAPLTKDHQPRQYAVWSPDGTKIAFSMGVVAIMNADATGQTVLVPQNAGGYLAWSPDGAVIAYSASTYQYPGFASSIAYINADGASVSGLAGHSGTHASWQPFVKSRALVGVGGGLGATAAGFLFGEQGKNITSVVAFDTTTAAGRANARVAAQTGLTGGTPDLVFSITTVDGLASLSYVDDIQSAVVSVPVAGATGALVSFDASDGTVATVLPYAAGRAAPGAPTTTRSGGTITVSGSFTGAWSRGANRAPHGASMVQLDAKTGAVLAVR